MLMKSSNKKRIIPRSIPFPKPLPKKKKKSKPSLLDVNLDIQKFQLVSNEESTTIYYDGNPKTLLFKVWRGKLNKEILQCLESSTQILTQISKPPKGDIF